MAENTFQHDIFLSYASEDRERITGLVKALESLDWSVWWDQRIPTGREFDEFIEEQLEASKSVEERRRASKSVEERRGRLVEDVNKKTLG